MRQIGKLPTQVQAERFTAYSIIKGFATVAEQEGDAWQIWVRDEDHLEEARQALTDFAGDPDSDQYADVVREAQELIQEEAKRREEARKNVVHMKGNWRQSTTRRAPLIITVIFLCGIVFVLSGLGKNPTSVARRALGFCDTMQRNDWNENRVSDRFVDIRHGQVWRLVTPIFLHADPMHILFNMLLLYYFGTRIESVRGSWRMGLLILLIALPSNLAQALAPATWGPLSGGPFFVGISGVVYGLLGYLWMKTVYAPEEGMHVNHSTVLFLLIWMILGFTGLLERFAGMSIANLAHCVGLLAGMAVGYLGISRR